MCWLFAQVPKSECQSACCLHRTQEGRVSLCHPCCRSPTTSGQFLLESDPLPEQWVSGLCEPPVRKCAVLLGGEGAARVEEALRPHTPQPTRQMGDA